MAVKYVVIDDFNLGSMPEICCREVWMERKAINEPRYFTKIHYRYVDIQFEMASFSECANSDDYPGPDRIVLAFRSPYHVLVDHGVDTMVGTLSSALAPYSNSSCLIS